MSETVVSKVKEEVLHRNKEEQIVRELESVLLEEEEEIRPNIHSEIERDEDTSVEEDDLDEDTGEKGEQREEQKEGEAEEEKQKEGELREEKLKEGVREKSESQNSKHEVTGKREEKEPFYENFFLQFGTLYLIGRIGIGLPLITSLIVCIVGVIILEILFSLLQRRKAKRGTIRTIDKPLRVMTLTPEALEGFLRNGNTPIDIEFIPERGEVKVIME